MTRKTSFWFIGLLLAALFACGAGLGMGLMLGKLSSRDTRAPAPLPAPTLTPTPAPTATPERASALATAAGIEPQLIQIYQQSSPAVVNITTKILRYDFFWGSTPENGSGSGFVWDAQGHILTNYHVVEEAHSIEVRFAPGVVLPAQVVGADPANDLAVIKVDALPPDVHPLPLADSDALQVGQLALAIGNPFGRFQRTMTAGIVSALDRTIRVKEGRVLRKVIQTDADINHGNSGGPLLNTAGQVVGVITAIYSPTGANAGVGLAIPINKAKRVVPVLIAKGRYAHPWLGIEHLGYAITPMLAARLGLPVEQGLLIARIYDSSPAMQAGIRPANDEVILGNYRYLIGGDILTAIDGVPLTSWEDMDAYLQENTEVGQEVILDIIREGQTMQVSVVLGEEP
jgi:S1-C subfamily serine protease